MRLLAWALLCVALAAGFRAYLQPVFIFNMSNLISTCF